MDPASNAASLRTTRRVVRQLKRLRGPAAKSWGGNREAVIRSAHIGLHIEGEVNRLQTSNKLTAPAATCVLGVVLTYSDFRND
jgi:hypothetical protein